MCGGRARQAEGADGAHFAGNARTSAATARGHETGSESQPRKRPVRSVASRIVSVLGAECGLDPTTVSLSEVSDWMEQSAHVIRICGESYTPPHKWSHLRGAAKLWSASAVQNLSGLGEPWAKIRAQYNVPGGMGIVEAVDHIMAESARRRALYQENCRQLHKVVDKIESEARDYLAIRDRVREAKIGFLQYSCRLPVVAMFSKEPQTSSRVMDIVSALDWARIRVHYDVIVAAQNAGILPLTPNGVIESEFYSFSPPSLDVKELFEELGRVRITTGSSAPASDVIEELSGQPVGCDVSVLRDFHSCREGVHCHRFCPSLGLKWVEVPGNCRPDGSEVDNVALQQALRERREFWHSEFEEFKIGERLSPLCFICVDGIYFQPAVPAPEFEGTDGLPGSLCVRCQVDVNRTDRMQALLCDHHARPKSEMEKRGQALYFGITKAVVLKQMKRQDANGAPCFPCPASFHQAGETCAYFANMLHRMRFGAVCDTDFEWAKHRQLSSVSWIRSFEKDLFDSSDSLWLVPKKVDQCPQFEFAEI
jgi:hypothetical protein